LIPSATPADRHQDGDVLHFAAPGALQPNPVQRDVGELALDRPVPPRLDSLVQLLIQLTDRAGGDARPPQRLGNIFHPADAHSGEVHLHQRLFHGRLSPSVTLDDLRLKRQAPQPRDLERHLARLRLQLPLVRAGPRIDAIGRSFVTLGPAELIRLGLQQAVERRFYAAPHFVHMTANLLLVDLNHAP
jgi:hypothetical protein